MFSVYFTCLWIYDTYILLSLTLFVSLCMLSSISKIASPILMHCLFIKIHGSARFVTAHFSLTSKGSANAAQPQRPYGSALTSTYEIHLILIYSKTIKKCSIKCSLEIYLMCVKCVLKVLVLNFKRKKNCYHQEN